MRLIVPGPAPAVFESPVEVLRAHDASSARACLAHAQTAHDRGAFVAGLLTYELGAALQGLPYHHSGMPLCTLGIFERVARTVPVASGPCTLSPLHARVARERYRLAIDTIRDAITRGDVYQVNYTVPFDLGFEGDPLGLFHSLVSEGAIKHAAYFEDGDCVVVSLSPELFLRIDSDGTVTTRPMKGTAPPDAPHLLRSEKNQAEHLMIVDLLRNDLQRIASGVRVDTLQTRERYPTYDTLTSTIRGKRLPQTSFADIITAMFPCGSITGAPKRAAMHYIHALEDGARGAYTGSLGFLAPDGSGWWNVAIRTLQLDTSTNLGRLDVGGGIVAESSAHDEWAEIGIKRRFLAEHVAPFEIWETFASTAQSAALDAHVKRAIATADAFDIPIDAPAIARHVRKFCSTAREPALVRLRIDAQGALRLSVDALRDSPLPVRVCLAQRRVQSTDVLLRYKTAWRPAHDAAWSLAQELECFDALLRNERGEITEGSRTNLFIERDGMLLTPPVPSGLLAGILRQSLLDSGRARENVLFEEDLAAAEAMYVGNDARGLLPAVLVKVPLRV